MDKILHFRDVLDFDLWPHPPGMDPWVRYHGMKANPTGYSTVQGFFHQPAHPRGEGATIKRISPPRKPPAGRDCGGSAAFPRWVLQIKIDRQSLPVFKFSWSLPRVRGGIK